MKDWGTSPDLYELSRAIPAKYARQKPGSTGGTYFPHYVINQVILATVGPFGWDLVEILRGDSEGQRSGKPVQVTNVIVGAEYRMTVTIDGHPIAVSEPGAVENAYLVANDGERLKRASSDALKRCAMRLGVGIQLWCKPGEHFLPAVLRTEQPTHIDDDEPPLVGGEADDERPFE